PVNRRASGSSGRERLSAWPSIEQPGYDTHPLAVLEGAPTPLSTARTSVAVGHAELVVLGDDELARVLAAGGALRVAVDLEGAERLLEGVVREQAADERVAQPEDDL